MGWSNIGETFTQNKKKNVGLTAEHYNRTLQTMVGTNAEPKRLRFSCNNGHCLQTQPNVGHTHSMRLIAQGELLSPQSI